MSTNKAEDITKSIKEVIETLMSSVMNKVLNTDPFLVDKFRAEKPLYAALVPDEIFKGSHFERRFVTPFGRVWEKLGLAAAAQGLGYAELGKSINGNIGEESLRRISEVLNRLEHRNNDGHRVKPNWDEEIKYIIEGGGNPIPVHIVCDLYAENNITKRKYAFELKSPLPNSDVTKVSKEKLLKLYSMNPLQIDESYFALPYNPYGVKENYIWSFPNRWFNMKTDKTVLIGNEFWDLIGGQGTYQLFIKEINNLGKEYRLRIYTEYLGIKPPENFDKEMLL